MHDYDSLRILFTDSFKILMQGKKADKKETGDMLSNLDGSS